MARENRWERIYSEMSRPFSIQTFRLKVPNGWIYCHTVTRFHWFARDDFSQSTVFVPDQA